MMKRFTPMVVALALVGLMALPAFAGPRGGDSFRYLRHLDLSEAQQAQIQGILESHRTGMQARMTAMMDARRALRETIHAETFDEAAVREAHANVAAEAEELAVERARTFADIRPILTPEQLERLNELPARGTGRRGMGMERGMKKGRGMGRGTGRGQGMGPGSGMGPGMNPGAGPIWDDSEASDSL